MKYLFYIHIANPFSLALFDELSVYKSNVFHVGNDMNICQKLSTSGCSIIRNQCIYPPPRGAIAPSGREPSHYRGVTIKLRKTTFGRTPLESDQLVAETSI